MEAGQTLKAVIAQVFREGNSFTALPGSAEDFDITVGGAILEQLGDSQSVLGGIITEAQRHGVELIPTVAAYAAPGGAVPDSVFERFADLITTAVGQRQPDLVLLDLHGAMLTDTRDDPEGELLYRLRQIAGDNTIIAAGFDLHGHITQRMLDNVDIITACKHNPHSDFFETGVRTARLAIQMARGEIHPVTYITRVPMLMSGNIGTDSGPLRTVHELARQAVGRHPALLDISIFNVIPLLDVPDMSQVILAVADGRDTAAKKTCIEIGEYLWDHRSEFVNDFPTIDRVLDYIDSHLDRGPYVVADYGDRVLSGAPGDSTEILSALLQRGGDFRAAIPLTEPRGVVAAREAGVGAVIELTVGGMYTRGMKPVAVEGEVIHLGDGEFRLNGPMHAGQQVCCGDTAILAIGSLKLMMSSRPAHTQDTGFFESQGVAIAEQDFVVVKSGFHFQLSFAGIATPLKAATGGVGAYIPGLFEVTRDPIYPETDADIGEIVAVEKMPATLSCGPSDKLR